MFPSKLDREQAALPFPRPQIWWIYKAGRGPGRASKLERPSVPRTPGAISEATSEVSRFSSSRLRLGRLRCVTSDFGAVGWQQGTRPPPPQAGCSLCHGKTPTHPAPTRRVISAPQECEPQSNDRVCVRCAPLRGRLAAWSVLVEEAAAPDSDRTAGSGRDLTRPRRPEFVDRRRPEVWRACAGVARGARTAGSAGRRGAHRA